MRELLQGYEGRQVDIFISYVKSLKTEKDKDGKLKNYWATKLSDEQYANLFKKSYSSGLPIDGDSVTITFRGKPIITYDYHAYKNKIILSYPETIFDFGLVYKGDDFSFRKENGKVIYSHIINNPFDNKKEIIGAYGIIKNSTGEFIELLNLNDINKMKNSSKMQHIWNAWFDRMVLKSVIKRICTIHFHDVVKDIDDVDNSVIEPERATIEESLLTDIDNAETEEQLGKIYKANVGLVQDVNQFLEVLSNRKKEINGTLS
jgi:hypothetical protein